MKLYVDDRLVRTIASSPDYRSAILLGVYENAGWTGSLDPKVPYPKKFAIDYFRAYRRDTSATQTVT